MTVSLIDVAVKAFNRHGEWTARRVEHGMAIEIREADTGAIKTTVWAPEERGNDWFWTAGLDLEQFPSTEGIAALVETVTTSLTGGTK